VGGNSWQQQSSGQHQHHHRGCDSLFCRLHRVAHETGDGGYLLACCRAAEVDADDALIVMNARAPASMRAAGLEALAASATPLAGQTSVQGGGIGQGKWLEWVDARE
jgi:hypothetical protein